MSSYFNYTILISREILKVRREEGEKNLVFISRFLSPPFPVTDFFVLTHSFPCLIDCLLFLFLPSSLLLPPSIHHQTGCDYLHQLLFSTYWLAGELDDGCIPLHLMFLCFFCTLFPIFLFLFLCFFLSFFSLTTIFYFLFFTRLSSFSPMNAHQLINEKS